MFSAKSGTRQVILATGFLAAVAACSRQGNARVDSATPSADSVIAATVAATPVPSSAAPAPPPTAVGRKTGSSPASSGTRPDLEKLTPTAATISPGTVVMVEITGSRFTSAANTVYFGAVRLDGLASPDGRVIRFSIPESIPSRGEVPPMMIAEGAYRVYVVNANGVSDTLTFTLRGQ